MAVYIWSDLHLNHTNIIKYCNRPFENVDDMNSYLIRMAKETIKEDDTIINLGDVAFNYNTNKMGNIIDTLPGYKILLMGNHDRRKSITFWKDVGFDEVYRKPIDYNQYVLSHEPLKNLGSTINIHGHVHNRIMHCPYKINVSVEVIDYRPILFDDLIEKYKIERGL